MEHATVTRYTVRMTPSSSVKRCWNGSVKQEPGEQRDTGLRDPQFL